MSFKIQKTESVRSVKNNEQIEVPVDSLPKEIRNQILIYDQIRSDIVDLEYKLQVFKDAQASRQEKIYKLLKENGYYG